MSYNIMNEYITLTKKEINQYMRLIFERQFQKEIFESFLDTYIKIRYYQFDKNEENFTLRKRILEQLKTTRENLIIENPEDTSVIENTNVFFDYMLYFDKVSNCKDIKQKIEKIEKVRQKRLNKNTIGFTEEFYKKVQENEKTKENLLNKFKSDIFFLKMKSYPNFNYIYKVKLGYDIKFPMIYSSDAIKKVYTTGITKEDKLTIEYYLTSLEVIKDILKGDFKKQYIVEFADSLCEKPQKLKNLLNIINNSAIQDKINLKVRYEELQKNKEQYYELIQNGFHIAVVLDNTISTDFSSLEKLNICNYIILNSKLKQYDEISQNKILLHNVIEI